MQGGRLNKVEICGVDTAGLKVLSEDEKMKLLKAVKEGDRVARNELIEGNLRLVLSVIRRFSPRAETMDDLFQVGCIGLIKAIDRFNTDLNVRFSTYAVPMIIGEIRRYQRDNNSVRVSRGTRDLAYRALMVREEIAKNEQREATLHEIALRLGESDRAVGDAMTAIVEPISLYDSVYNDGEDSVYVIDQLADDSVSDEAWVENMSLKEALKRLTPKEKGIIARRFYRGRTQMEIAEEIGISQAQVSRLEKNAIKAIRRQF